VTKEIISVHTLAIFFTDFSLELREDNNYFQSSKQKQSIRGRLTAVLIEKEGKNIEED
jgi:hypothetical protein